MISQTPVEQMRSDLRQKAKANGTPAIEYYVAITRLEVPATAFEKGFAEGYVLGFEEGERTGLVRLLNVLQHIAQGHRSCINEVSSLSRLELIAQIERLKLQLGVSNTN